MTTVWTKSAFLFEPKFLNIFNLKKIQTFEIWMQVSANHQIGSYFLIGMQGSTNRQIGPYF